MVVHVIVGAGPVGTATARMLADRGEQVRMISRRGGGPDHPGVERVAADATDTARLTTLTSGATVLYNCANPRYHRWPTDWPPLAASLLAAAERSGPVLATASNLYGYGEVDGPITEHTPLSASHPKLRIRADMWRDALAAHEAGRLRATEVRASDYIEANSVAAMALDRLRPTVRKLVSPVPVDQPHSWTSIHDVARTLIAAGGHERAWGRAWLVPTNPPLTQAELVTRYAELAGLTPPKLYGLPYPLLWTIGLLSPTVRELRTVRYQFDRPFEVDSSATTSTLALAPTPLDNVLRQLVTDKARAEQVKAERSRAKPGAAGKERQQQPAEPPDQP